MASNVYTKNEILKELASRGYFIDAYTLETFLTKWKVESIFEDEQGSEFYDKNTLDLVLSNLFNANPSEEKKEKVEEPRGLKQVKKEEPVKTINPALNVIPETITSAQQTENNVPEIQFEKPKENTIPTFNANEIKENNQTNFLNISKQPQMEIIDEELKLENNSDASLLNSISLSDGTSLLNKIQESPNFSQMAQNTSVPSFNIPEKRPIQKPEEEYKPGILEGAMETANIPPENMPPAESMPQEENSNDNTDFDDISLLSESLEAQEKFRQYVVSELEKKNVDLTPKNNEFKLDISERTISMIARTMAKKIAKHVNNIFSAEAKNVANNEEIKEENKRLEKKARELEDQNRKLRLLLTESNKNLNSYKPSFFGLYKKVPPEK